MRNIIYVDYASELDRAYQFADKQSPSGKTRPEVIDIPRQMAFSRIRGFAVENARQLMWLRGDDSTNVEHEILSRDKGRIAAGLQIAWIELIPRKVVLKLIADTATKALRGTEFTQEIVNQVVQVNVRKMLGEIADGVNPPY